MAMCIAAELRERGIDLSHRVFVPRMRCERARAMRMIKCPFDPEDVIRASHALGTHDPDVWRILRSLDVIQ
jgi:hypothetical protein